MSSSCWEWNDNIFTRKVSAPFWFRAERIELPQNIPTIEYHEVTNMNESYISILLEPNVGWTHMQMPNMHIMYQFESILAADYQGISTRSECCLQACNYNPSNKQACHFGNPQQNCEMHEWIGIKVFFSGGRPSHLQQSTTVLVQIPPRKINIFW